MENSLMTKKRFRMTDAAAVFLCAGLFGYLGCSARIGFAPIDESFYYTVVQRWLAGDRLLIDDWHFEQLNVFLQILPFRFFRFVTGSNDGVILFLRFVCLGVALILFWFFYWRLRRFGMWGLIGVALFSSYVPMAIMTLNYYTMALNGLLVVCVILFVGKEEKKIPPLIFAGIVFACVVVAEPFVALLYFAWSALLALRMILKKKGRDLFGRFSFILNVRSWLFVTAGILLVATVFLIWLLRRSPLTEILRTIPEFLSDSEYAVQGGAGSRIFQPEKLWETMRYFGILPPLFGGFLVFAAAGLRKRKLLSKWRAPLFCVACAGFASALVCAAVLTARVRAFRGAYAPTIQYYYYFQNAPILLFCPICLLLCERFDRRLFCFWLTSVTASAMIDLASDIVIGMGGAVAAPVTLIAFGTVLREVRAERAASQELRKRSKRRSPGTGLSSAFAALAIISLIGWEGFGVYTHAFYPVVEAITNTSEDHAITETVRRGPLKGIRTTARINGLYEDMLSDLDRIRADTDGPVYVTKLLSYLYLYMDLPVGSYSTWYVEGESETRQLRYWALHPDRRPTYIYVPDYDFTYRSYLDSDFTVNWKENKLAFLEKICDCTIMEGKAGAIVRVDRWPEQGIEQ